VHIFEFVGTLDYTPFLCIPAALDFRNKICGGEESIRNYCWEIARVGGARVAEILGTSVMATESGSMSKCCFANVELPLKFGNQKVGKDSKEGERVFGIDEASMLAVWINKAAVKEYDTYLQLKFHAGKMWVRLSGQIYLELSDFEYVGTSVNELCARVDQGEFMKEIGGKE